MAIWRATYIIMSWMASTIGAPDPYGWRVLARRHPYQRGPGGRRPLDPGGAPGSCSDGRETEARAVMARYGAVGVEADVSGFEDEAYVRAQYCQLFDCPFTGLAAVIVMLALGIGVVQFDFQQWLPSNLQRLGFNEVNASRSCGARPSSGFALNFPVALVYGFWSSRMTILLIAALTGVALVGFAVAGANVAHNSALPYILLVGPIWGISSLTAVTASYAAEIYQTGIRARGAGPAAAGTTMGGVVILAAVAATVAAPSIATTALLGAVPLVVGMGLIVFFGVETRRKGLERITAEELAARKAWGRAE